MSKKSFSSLTALSLSLAALSLITLIVLSPLKASSPNKKLKLSQVQHFIILNINSKLDQKFLKVFKYTNYLCTPLNLSLVQCSLYTNSSLHVAEALAKSLPIYHTSSKKGVTINVYQGFNGETHLKIETLKLKNIYSFASLKQLKSFTKSFSQEIFPKDLSAEIKSSPFIL